MKLIRGLYNIRPEHHGCVATIGNFDGVHKGHQALLKQLVALAKEHDLPATVIIFEPQPLEFFIKEKAPARLSLITDKLELLAKFGVERVVCLPFTAQFAKIKADDFVEQVLIKALGIKALIVGDDFRFGYKRQGDINTLKQYAGDNSYRLQIMDTVVDGESRISSSLIRELLSTGQIAKANEYLGRTYAITGRVGHGDKRGRELGYPTANIPLTRRLTPVHGIYTVTVDGLSEQSLPAIASVGTRPTIGGSKKILETFIFDFEQWIYGKRIKINFLEKIRDELRFDSLDAMKIQMADDVKQAKHYFESHYE